MLALEIVEDQDQLRRWVHVRNRLDPLDATSFDLVAADLDRPEPVVRTLGADASGADVIAGRAFVRPDASRSSLDIWCADGDEAGFTQMCDLLERWARERCAGPTRTWVYDHAAHQLRALLARGWQEYGRKPVVGCRPFDVGLPTRPLIDGIEFLTLEQHPALTRAVYEAYSETWLGTPWGAGEGILTFERWWANIEEWPGAAPDQFLLALDGDVVAGYTELTFSGSEDDDRRAIWHGYTGVREPYRRRGIARALKLWSIEWCRANGVQLLLTANDADNMPMRALNAELGYAPQFSYVSFERPPA